MQVYYNNGTETVGPVDITTLDGSVIHPDTLVWYEEMPEWLPASQVPLFNDILIPLKHTSSPTPPPLPEMETADQELVMESKKSRYGLAVTAMILNVMAAFAAFPIPEDRLWRGIIGVIAAAIGVILAGAAMYNSTLSKHRWAEKKYYDALVKADISRNISIVAIVLFAAATITFSS